MSGARIGDGRAVRRPRGREARGQPTLIRAVGVHDPDLGLVASIGSIRDLRAVGRPRRVELKYGGMGEPGQVRAVRVDRPHVLVVVERDPPGERGPIPAAQPGNHRGCRGLSRAILRLLSVGAPAARLQYKSPRQSHREDAAPPHALCTPRPAPRFPVDRAPRRTSVRPVCWNTISLGEAEARRSGRNFTFRHTKNVLARIEEAKRVIAGAREETAAFVELANELAWMSVSDEQRERFVTTFIPKPEAEVISDQVLDNILRERAKVRAIFDGPTIPEAHRNTA
jgi:Domain of unknown function (DUF932)